MTFIDEKAVPPTPGRIAGYSILCAASLVCAARAVALGQTRSHYRSLFSVRVMFPLAILIIALENATLASSGRFYDDDVDDIDLVKVVFALQALEVPILLVVTFETTYLVHKRRSVNFCGMFFDEGRRVNRVITTPVMSFMLRNFVRAMGVVLLAMGIVANFDLLEDVTRVDELAGRAGWWSLFDDERDWDEKVHLLLSLLPTAILIVMCFYLSIMLWRYGTQSSMVVHSSMLNPWFSPFFGTVALTAGQFFAEDWFPLTSNIGVLIFIVSILALMAEVDKDMVAADEFADFLAQCAAKGDSITYRNVLSVAIGERRVDGVGKKPVEIHMDDMEVVTEVVDGVAGARVECRSTSSAGPAKAGLGPMDGADSDDSLDVLDLASSTSPTPRTRHKPPKIDADETENASLTSETLLENGEPSDAEGDIASAPKHVHASIGYITAKQKTENDVESFETESSPRSADASAEEGILKTTGGEGVSSVELKARIKADDAGFASALSYVNQQPLRKKISERLQKSEKIDS